MKCGNAAREGRNFVTDFFLDLTDKIKKKFFVIDYQNTRVVCVLIW